MNFWDYLLIAGLLVVCFFAWRAAKKHGMHSCGGDCSSCQFCEHCKQKDKQEKKKQ